MSSSEEAQALGRSEFWDERYAKADGDRPTHEWFRAFDALEPFFDRYLFKERGEEGKRARVLHLGSGDSVRFYFLYFFSIGGSRCFVITFCFFFFLFCSIECLG